jgi:3-deoxy-7-phosphoheptulonate synthase
LDISSVPVIKTKSHLPIIVDPSHATGVRDYVKSLSQAAVAAGADGLMIETHPDPSIALSDGPQSLSFDQFEDLMGALRPLVALLGKKM